ncbi:MAG: helix-turn-helix domain-containing protein, partial [Chloroflexota bacterium]|nr:helix-turn-helix domain-containing protein [Chloroflexota bacterium]
MTARHQIRIGSRRIGRDRATIDATPAPSLGETLQIARERKGVDLFRAERDTKIRFKYLAALEDSHFDDLPAAVYTKGFLRNYAIYLGLDPEEVLERWRDEMAAAQGRKAERPVVAPPPRPIAVPRRSFTISGGWLVAALVLMAVIGFVAYIGVQMMRFIETPAVSLTNPRSLVSQVEAESIVLSGASGPGALVTIHGPGGLLLNTTADEKGSWSREVPLSRGQNDFTVVANDPVTRRDSPELHVIVTVPLLSASPGVSPPSDAPPELRLGLVGPVDGATVEGGELTVSGSTSGTRITIAGELLAANAAESPSPGTGRPAPAER